MRELSQLRKKIEHIFENVEKRKTRMLIRVFFGCLLVGNYIFNFSMPLNQLQLVCQLSLVTEVIQSAQLPTPLRIIIQYNFSLYVY